MKLTPAEVEHMHRWRAFQAWIASLPPGLLVPLKAVRNPDCAALKDSGAKPTISPGPGGPRNK